VASRVGGIPEVICDGETGLLCEVLDVEAMTAAALRLLQDASEHQRMSAAARARVLAHFTAEPLVLRYEAYYRRLLSDSEC
jgi:glycosyltransferase involved in cell wall biosynthesis